MNGHESLELRCGLAGVWVGTATLPTTVTNFRYVLAPVYRQEKQFRVSARAALGLPQIDLEAPEAARL